MVEIKISTDVRLAHLDTAIHPQPAKNFIPKWFKDMPVKVPHENYDFDLMPHDRTLKACPSFHDIWNTGIVYVASTDMHLGVIWNDFTKEWDASWHTPSRDYGLDIHASTQFTDHEKDSGVKFIFKFVSPFRMYGPKGYSVYQMPMFYHFNQMKDWYVPYGVIGIDTHHEINQQIMYISDKKELIIKKGTPLATYVPFKREEFNFKYEEWNKDLEDRALLSKGNIFTHFKNGYMKTRNK